MPSLRIFNMAGPGRIFQKVGRPLEGTPVRKFVKGIEVMASKRLNICHDCKYYDAQWRRCKACGCFTSAKARIPQAKCPKGYWPAETR